MMARPSSVLRRSVTRRLTTSRRAGSRDAVRSMSSRSVCPFTAEPPPEADCLSPFHGEAPSVPSRPPNSARRNLRRLAGLSIIARSIWASRSFGTPVMGSFNTMRTSSTPPIPTLKQNATNAVSAPVGRAQEVGRSNSRARSSVREQGQTLTWTPSHRGTVPFRCHRHTSPERWQVTAKLLDSTSALLVCSSRSLATLLSSASKSSSSVSSVAALQYGSHRSRNPSRKSLMPRLNVRPFLDPLMRAMISIFLPVKAAFVRLADPKYQVTILPCSMAIILAWRPLSRVASLSESADIESESTKLSPHSANTSGGNPSSSSGLLINTRPHTCFPNVAIRSTAEPLTKGATARTREPSILGGHGPPDVLLVFAKPKA